MATDPTTIADAGFAPGYEKRHPLRTDEHVRAKIRTNLARALRGPSLPAACLGELPPGFIEPQIARICTHLRNGHWEQVRETLEDIERQWAEYQADQRPVSTLLWPDRIKAHVTRLGLPLRIVNAIEEVCDGTIGGLREAFPGEFIDLPNVGIETIRLIAAALVRGAVLDEPEAVRAIERWADRERLPQDERRGLR